MSFESFRVDRRTWAQSRPRLTGRLILLVVVAVTVATISPVAAQGEASPSDGTACQGLVGALKGLCFAYCEAMDCDGFDPHASDKACEKTKAQWDAHAGGAELPCRCPCLSFGAFECPFGFECDIEGGDAFAECGTPQIPLLFGVAALLDPGGPTGFVCEERFADNTVIVISTQAQYETCFDLIAGACEP